MRYKEQPIDPQVVGHDLRVRAVLIGMTKIADEFAIRTELVDDSDNHRLWGRAIQQSSQNRAATVDGRCTIMLNIGKMVDNGSGEWT